MTPENFEQLCRMQHDQIVALEQRIDVLEAELLERDITERELKARALRATRKMVAAENEAATLAKANYNLDQTRRRQRNRIDKLEAVIANRLVEEVLES